MPAFLGLVPPTTFVPRFWRQLGSWRLLGRVQGRAHTVLDGLLGVETVPLSAQSTAHTSCTDASEALEEDLGLAVDAQVLDGL